MDRCFAALAAWQARAARRVAGPGETARLAPPGRRGAGRSAARFEQAMRLLTEREAKAVLTAYGVGVVGDALGSRRRKPQWPLPNCLVSRSC